MFDVVFSNHPQKTSFQYSQRLIEILPAIIRKVQNSIEKV